MTYSIMLEGVRRDADGAIIPADPNNRDWLDYQTWIATGNVPTPLPTPTLDELKATKRASLADKRWRVETSGYTVNGLTFATDRESVLLLGGAGGSAKMDASFSCPHWKLKDGSFVTLDNATLIAAATAVRDYVQSCFSREALISAYIQAAPDEATLAAVDIDAGWPG